MNDKDAPAGERMGEKEFERRLREIGLCEQPQGALALMAVLVEARRARKSEAAKEQSIDSAMDLMAAKEREIRAQDAEIAALREALRKIADGSGRWKECDAGCPALARAALGEEK